MFPKYNSYFPVPGLTLQFISPNNLFLWEIRIHFHIVLIQHPPYLKSFKSHPKHVLLLFFHTLDCPSYWPDNGLPPKVATWTDPGSGGGLQVLPEKNKWKTLTSQTSQYPPLPYNTNPPYHPTIPTPSTGRFTRASVGLVWLALWQDFHLILYWLS